MGDILVPPSRVGASGGPTGGAIGYGSAQAAGGAVTQLTNRATAVTLDALTGQITTHNASLAAEGSADFVVTDPRVRATDVIALSFASGVVGAGTLAMVVAVAS